MCRQYVVGSLEVGYNLLHQFVVCKLVVTGLLLRVYLINLLINPGHLIPELHQLEIEVSTEETNLTFTDSLCLCIHSLAVGQRYQCTVATTD